MAVDSVGCDCHLWNFQIRLDLVDLLYLLNIIVISYSIVTQVAPLDSYEKCESVDIKYVKIEQHIGNIYLEQVYLPNFTVFI